MKKIVIKLNGETRYTHVEPNDTLLDILRDNLGATSVKSGCERGDCGACAVLLQGESVRSCLIFAVEADGQAVETIEGMSKDRKMSDLQTAFHEKNAFQCGFCAPGTIISTVELLKENPQPEKAEIQEAIAGNLCRCTGYSTIIDTVKEFSEKK